MISDIQKIGMKSETTEIPHESTHQRTSTDNRKSLTARVKPEDLAVFNQRLKLFGFNSVNELVHAFIAGRFPQIREDKQIGDIVHNTQSTGQRTVLEDGNNFGRFYQSIDLEDMSNYYQNV
ncbi:MAG: hypothetical protein M3270_05280, partial [Thermoproteota archaeon]|nr:hypothetical protein [Thermoproteota archaeon]